ncbi:ABC transporter permease [Sedimentibacter sp. MB31-C6]|uniref:ABC transporter permease n=1 Tax=Sedimentibacter sp. MB31-C6 TaxID=3109366 RepID=UPI002DDD12D4|nr:ABC transporter permease [Sedimentibacter sp. MB36-C1]WSI03371.1 ABC transporter permease [Sedimentibacter sp. MB36-C1]
MNTLLLTSIEQGLIFSILAIGMMITFKILNFADMSVEGTFPMGAFVFAKFITAGMSPITSTILAFLLGTLAGLITYTLNIKLKIKALLSGILTMTILYSVNLRLNGKSNIGLFNYSSIFDGMEVVIVLVLVVVAVKTLMDMFLKTEVGYLLIATGDNETLVKSLGEDSNKYKLIGLMLSNGLVSLSGALMAQYQGFAEITMGTGIIVVAIASVIVGDTMFKKLKLKNTTRAIIGAVIYKFIGAVAIDLGLEPTDLKAINAIIVIGFLSYNTFSLDIKNITKRKVKITEGV